MKKTIVADGEVAGNVGRWLSDGKREIGYWIDRAFWGRGIATEAVSTSYFPLSTFHFELPVWPHTTRPRSASCKNAGSPYSAPRKQLPMTPKLRTFSCDSTRNRGDWRRRISNAGDPQISRPTLTALGFVVA
ncbi:MAG: GNAT family N-acetyltransferase [Verrucomicrobiota bacterium]|nr:GNAT family N-acetyltransferase [Verrucomicrobiota bacterium]